MLSSESEDQDDALEQGIALSLQENQSNELQAQSNDATIIDLLSDTEDDDEDEELRQAIALSLRHAGESSSPNLSAADTSHFTIPIASTTCAKSTITTDCKTIDDRPGLLGLDRKAMEQERLARLNKRKREVSEERPRKQIIQTEPIKDKPHVKATHASNAEVLQYPKGVIKRTFALKYPRTDDISIDEVLQAPSVNIAVISSFVWDSEWFYGKLDPTKVKQIWIMNAKDQETQQRWIREMKESSVPNLKVHFPPMSGVIYSMHSKYMLLFGKNKLRLVVTTANMTQTDWGEVANSWQPAVMENSVFLIDLPRMPNGKIGTKDELTSFGKELIHFLEAQEIDSKVVDGVLKFDFSHTDHLAFIHSIGGVHDCETGHPTGIPGLSKAIQDLKLDKIKSIELDYSASSLGAINDNLLERLYVAACGMSLDMDAKPLKVRDRIRIYFPTSETVDKSVGGSDCGGVITLTKKNFDASTFPRSCLRDYDSNRRGVLSHNKLLFARGYKQDGTAVAWVYLGSANISEAAWGEQKRTKSQKTGKLNIRNWECGIVMVVPTARIKELGLDVGAIPPMSVFERTIEVPFVFPGKPYNDRQPWFFKSGDRFKIT